MDPDVMRWVLEFLLLQSSIPDTTIMKIMVALPASDTDSRLKKIILLRTIQSDFYKASITEKMLDLLEVLEELYRSDGIPITESMKDAYCAVAMECTVKHLAVSPNGSVEYFDAVKSIWRDKFWQMDDIGEKSELVLKLTQWRDDIEAALWSSEVCERLADMNTRRDALKKVGAYLEEARRMIGISFIELVAHGIVAGNELVEVATDMPVKSCGIGVNDFVHNIEETNAVEGMKGIVSEPMSENEGMQVTVIESMNEGEGGHKIISEPLDESEGKVSGPMNEDGMTFETRNEGEGIAAEPEKRRTESLTNRRGDCIAKDRIELDSGAACRAEAPLTGGNQANEERAVNFAGGSDPPIPEQVQPETRGDCSAKDRIEFDNGGVCTEGAPVKGGNQADEQVEERAVNLAGGNDPPIQEKRDSQKSNLQLKCKHVASHRQHGRVKITGAEEMGQVSSSIKYDCVPSHEVEEVRESLKSSLFDLQALVKDPLPDALHISETVISELTIKDVNHKPPLVVKPSTDVDVPGSDNANLGNVGRPSLMERNNTARVYEWDDSIDDLPEGTLNCASRFHLPSPKRDNKSPLKRYEAPKLTKRRKRKGWSVLEEDTLRAGVQKFGVGNWKVILNANRDTFDERTEVDLKDKWRNMTRY